MKYKSYIATILAIWTMVSCADFLEEKRTTVLSPQNLYATEESLEACIQGCYANMGSGQGWKGGMFEFLQCASGLVHWSGARSEEHQLQCLDFTLYSNNSWNENFYITLNAYIAQANLLLSNLPDSPVNADFKAEIEAEAKFIRAVCYFSLVRMYGDVPVHTAAATCEDDTYVPRSPYTEVYRQILEDLNFAEKYMRDASQQRLYSGRPCKWAATSYKALVYLHIACILETPQDENFYNPDNLKHLPDFSGCEINNAAHAWTLALETAEKVINQGPYVLADDYSHLFRWGWRQEGDTWIRTPEDYILGERIFVLQSTNNATTNTSYFVQRSVPPFPEGSSNETAENAQAGRVRPERYVVQKWTKEYGGRLDTERVDKLTGVWIDCKDPRFDVTYVHTGYNFNHANYKGWVDVYPADGCVKTTGGTTLTFKDGSTYSGNFKASVYFKKYIDHEYDAGKGNADFYMMRFAELYLIAAEAAASLSTTPDDENWQKALNYVEVLHARARGELSPSAVQSDYPTWKDGNHKFATKDELIKAIMWERVYELSGEGHEFFDTHRRGASYIRNEIAIPINAFLAEDEQASDLTNGYFAKEYQKMAYNTEVEVLRKGLLCAFPTLEIRYNKAITDEDQNDYFVR